MDNSLFYFLLVR